MRKSCQQSDLTDKQYDMMEISRTYKHQEGGTSMDWWDTLLLWGKLIFYLAWVLYFLLIYLAIFDEYFGSELKFIRNLFVYLVLYLGEKLKLFFSLPWKRQLPIIADIIIIVFSFRDAQLHLILLILVIFSPFIFLFPILAFSVFALMFTIKPGLDPTLVYTIRTIALAVGCFELYRLSRKQ